ncbi:NlpC/P60 family protein [Kribbella monticola]|uniref:NlpC/P60 family protein n=1 Tax=Kribbella monticola TaxID=2185285 RepID=UPI0013006D0C|nr:NlpC/P60 family protein [Kribbella monticola]
MPKLSIAEIYDAALSAGFTPQQATTWTAIAMAESGGRTGALNDKGEHSVGLWQINVASDGGRASRYGDLNDPRANARAAYAISNHGTDMRPWTTTHDSHKGTAADYRTYLDQVEAVTGVQGDDRGVGGYSSHLPPPLPSSNGAGHPAMMQPATYDQIDAGHTVVGMQSDSDHDGLTDAFEQAAGTGVKVADTDHDGLTDGYEVAVSHSSPLLADGDSDGLSDSTEASLGSNPLKWDSDNDGLSDKVELAYGSDPQHADAGDGVIPGPPQPAVPQLAGQQLAGQQFAGQQTMQQTGVQLQTLQAAGTPGAGAGSTKVERFVDVALAQEGDKYVFGVRAKLDDPNPDKFDCSELTKWAAHQAGVEIPDGAMYQYLDLKQKDSLISVDQAMHTKGALLFYFSDEPTPGGGRPSRAHVAISLGDGRTIEAKGTKYGVGEFTAHNRFNYAGVIPGLDSSMAPAGHAAESFQPVSATPVSHYDQIDLGTSIVAPPDTDHDGLTDAFEKLAGTSPTSADTDKDGLPDAFEAIKSHTDPLSADTDHDGVSDPFELSAGTDPGKIPGVAGVGGQGQFAEVIRGGVVDTDHDGLTDTYETRAGLNPHSMDTDGDGLSDSSELSLGTNAAALDSDHDGISDSLEVQFGSDPVHSGLGGDLGANAGTGMLTGVGDGLDPGADGIHGPEGLGGTPDIAPH